MNTLPLPLSDQTASALRKLGSRTAKIPAVVGLDGFVDLILHAVKRRESPKSYDRYASISEFGEKISAAAGLSANFEFVIHMTKLGGNGPIMANALAALGLPLTYIGSLGKPAIHPVFEDFGKRAKLISISEPGYTDALEFDDGKLIFGKHQSLRDVNWANLILHVPEPRLIQLFQKAGFVGMVNWTMLLNMTDIFKKLLTRVAPKLKGPRKCIFFDLADPAKRTREDLLDALRLIGRFEKYFRVILGLNLQEGRQVSSALGLGPIEERHDDVAIAAEKIRDVLKVDTVVVHPVAFAGASDATGTTHVVGPFCAKPLITTGAGDHFNAGFSLGRMLGLPLDQSLQCGVATSGFYVRKAKSPSVPELARFIKTHC